jgi:hypothetical protein
MTESAKKTKSAAPAAPKAVAAKGLTVVDKPGAKLGSKTPVIASKKKVPVTKAKKPSAKVAKPHKQKMVRDSFTMPADDYSKLNILKAKCLENGMEVKKSELIRAGLIALSGMPVKNLLSTVTMVEKIKTGRPKGK